jgi:hypothetical protein
VSKTQCPARHTEGRCRSESEREIISGDFFTSLVSFKIKSCRGKRKVKKKANDPRRKLMKGKKTH